MTDDTRWTHVTFIGNNAIETNGDQTQLPSRLVVDQALIDSLDSFLSEHSHIKILWAVRKHWQQQLSAQKSAERNPNEQKTVDRDISPEKAHTASQQQYKMRVAFLVN